MSTFLLIFVLVILFVLFAFFSLAETAIFSVNRYKLRHLASAGNRRAAQLTEWLDQPEPLLATILLGSNFASIGAATLGATLVSRWVVDPNLIEFALIAEAVLLTLFVLLFCELGPKALAASNTTPSSKTPSSPRGSSRFRHFRLMLIRLRMPTCGGF